MNANVLLILILPLFVVFRFFLKSAFVFPISSCQRELQRYIISIVLMVFCYYKLEFEERS